jgi:hypothetical protein
MQEAVRNIGVNVQTWEAEVGAQVFNGSMRMMAAIVGERRAAGRLDAIYQKGNEKTRKKVVRAVVGILAQSKGAGLGVESLLEIFRQGLNDPSEAVEKTLLKTYFSVLEKSHQAKQVWPGNLPTAGWVWHRLQNKELMKPYQRLGRR